MVQTFKIGDQPPNINPSLRNTHLKTARAKKHLAELKREILLFQKTKPCRLTPKSEPQSVGHNLKSFSFNITIDPAPPELGIIVGDFIVCLRGALDHLAWQLSLLNTKTPASSTGFPIHADDLDDSRKRFTSATKSMPTEAIAIIRELQPYHAGNAYKDNRLWQLNKLCNIDKHRQIPIRGNSANLAMHRSLNQGDVMIERGGRMKLKPNIPIEVIFGDFAEGIELRLTDLEAIYEIVCDDVVPRFPRFFQEGVGGKAFST